MNVLDALKVVIDNSIEIEDSMIFIPNVDTFKELFPEHKKEQLSPHRVKLSAKWNGYDVYTVISNLVVRDFDFYLF